MDILPLLRILIQMLFKHTRLLWKSQEILNRTGAKCLKNPYTSYNRRFQIFAFRN